MHLDSRTVVIVATFVAVVPVLVTAAVWFTKPTSPGFGRWTLGTLLGTFALVLLSLRGVAPDWVSIVIANMLALGAAILYFQGVRMFCGLRVYLWPEYLVSVLAIAVVIYFRYVANYIDFRIFALSLVMGSFGFVNGITLLRIAPIGRGFSTVFTVVVFLLAGVVHIFRGIYVCTVASNTDLFAPSPVNAAFFTAASLGVVGWSFGFILMTGERQASIVIQGVSLPEIGKAVPEPEVWQQVQRIILSEGFRRSARMERFLTLAVERTLHGRPEDLKEYALGRDVFNRGEHYDPRADSIVRVEAQRLRRKLREYYDTSGKNDSVIVEFHAGSYVPTIRYAKPRDMYLTISKKTAERY
jgi:hypothetical protein